MTLSTKSRQESLEVITERFCDKLAETVVERDERGGTAQTERKALRRSGLLNLLIPEEWGGQGADWPQIYRLIRQISRTDSSIGQLFGFQQLMLATIDLFGSIEQKQELYRRTVDGHWFWGNTLNPLDRGLTARWEADSLVLDGRKRFSTGSIDADALIISAPNPDNHQLLVAAVSLPREGILPLDDWDNMGQRQTDSGTVEFRGVRINASELLRTPGPFGSIRASLRPCIAQLIFANVYLGIAEGAFQEAKAYVRANSRTWLLSGVTSKEEDPYILYHFGKQYAELEAARLVTDRAAITLQHAWELAEMVSESERGRAAVDIATAKVVTTRTGLDVVNRMFEVMGASATSRVRRFDRFWRNLRTYTLHDPVDYKLRELGEWALSDIPPRPTFYS
ncbi:MAG: acyl-CoA dehydrogenase family protein [Cyanobacteriota bacterium]|jgi:alkylation response protein AidB-like acyl-CoA dehydrogenase